MNDTENQGTPAVGFLVMAFTDEKAGDDALKAMQAAKQQKQFYFENAAVIRQDTAGKVHYHETGDMKTGKGAGVGALIGGVIGIFGGPAGVALGASTGAAVGAAAAYRDTGFRDESLKTVGQAMKPGTSAVAAITNVAFLRDLQKQADVDSIRAFVDKLAAEISSKLNAGQERRPGHPVVGIWPGLQGSGRGREISQGDRPGNHGRVGGRRRGRPYCGPGGLRGDGRHAAGGDDGDWHGHQGRCRHCR